MQEVVREFVLEDGIGAQFYRKIYAMCYAMDNGLPFFNRKIKDFFIHEADNVKTEEDEQRVLDFFNNFLINPWDRHNFSGDLTVCPRVGEGAPDTMGQIMNTLPQFTKHGPTFNPDNITENTIVIHIRRGNVVPGNPRWLDESIYIKILENINGTIKQLGLDNPEIVIVTDAPDTDKKYKPINKHQDGKWNQDHLVRDENGYFDTVSLNFDRFRHVLPNIIILNNLNPEDAFLKMLRAKVLVVSPSIFSHAAALLSKNTVIDVCGRKVRFNGSYGHFDDTGMLFKYDPTY